MKTCWAICQCLDYLCENIIMMQAQVPKIFRAASLITMILLQSRHGFKDLFPVMVITLHQTRQGFKDWNTNTNIYGYKYKYRYRSVSIQIQIQIQIQNGFSDQFARYSNGNNIASDKTGVQRPKGGGSTEVQDPPTESWKGSAIWKLTQKKSLLQKFKYLI